MALHMGYVIQSCTFEDKMLTFLKLTCFCQKLTKTGQEIKKLYIWESICCFVQFTQTRAAQCSIKTILNCAMKDLNSRFKNLKNMKEGHKCPLYSHLLRKESKLAYTSCNFVSKRYPHVHGSQKPSIHTRYFYLCVYGSA